VYELFYYPGNASLAPHFILEELGVPFQLRLVDRAQNAQKDVTYLERNPMGRIPTLVDGELVIFESAAICLHLADRHPEAQLAPPLGSAQRAHLYKWLMFLTNTIQPDFMAFYYPETYTVDEAAREGVKHSAEGRLDRAYAVVDEALVHTGAYLLGDTLSIADFYLLMLVRWGRSQSRPPGQLPAIRRWAGQMATRPSVAQVVQTERLGRLY
jgi:glutathione S-transferase